jgi:hypothetical protein
MADSGEKASRDDVASRVYKCSWLLKSNISKAKATEIYTLGFSQICQEVCTWLPLSCGL